MPLRATRIRARPRLGSASGPSRRLSLGCAFDQLMIMMIIKDIYNYIFTNKYHRRQ